jgi:2-isopropylmalate synthase
LQKISIFDTTLRDGEQAAGAAMSLDEKLDIAIQLQKLNVDVIETGFPAASKDDLGAVNIIAKEVTDTTLCVFARAVESDIDLAAKALKGVQNGRLQIVSPTSDVHLQKKLQIDRDKGLELIRNSVKYAKNLVSEVAWIGEDCSRADPAYRIDCFNAAAESGASVVSYADTVGYATPEDIHQDIKSIVTSLSEEFSVIVGIHCHDDMGLAVANSLSGLQAGATEVQCTINGIGERAGNAALEEIVMAIKLRPDCYEFDLNVDTQLLMQTSELVVKHSGMSIANNKSIVGKNAFAHGSGLHQFGILKDASTYEIMSPETVGCTARKFVIGRHSGRHGLKHKLLDLGYELKNEDLEQILELIKSKLKNKRYINDDELLGLIETLKSN